MITPKKELDSICGICLKGRPLFLFSATDYITKEAFEIYQCPECKTAVTLPRLADEELQKYYQNAYYGKRKSFTDSLINYSRLGFIKNSGRNIRERTILDIGCGNGLFIFNLRKNGWKIAGTELAPEAHINSEVLPVVCRNSLEKCGFPDESFGLITMWHSLEHLNEPETYLKEANRLLKKGGVLVVEVPNIESWQAIITGKNWFHLESPRHRFHFSLRGLETILQKTGFSAIRVSYRGFVYGVFGWAQSIFNLIAKRKNLLFDFLNGKITLSEFLRNRTDALMLLLGIIPVSTISFFLHFAEKLSRRGSIMRIIAEKT